MSIAPVICLPVPSSVNVIEDILRIGEDLHASNLVPRFIVANPFKRTNAGKKLHSIVVTFRASEINNLFFVATHFVRIYDDGRAARFASRIFETGAIREYVNRAWISCHEACPTTL